MKKKILTYSLIIAGIVLIVINLLRYLNPGALLSQPSGNTTPFSTGYILGYNYGSIILGFILFLVAYSIARKPKKLFK